MNDPEFETAFMKGELAPELFNHEAHLRLAWIHLNKYGLKTALINIDEQLKAFVKQVGAEEKYNKTLTYAAVYTVNHFKDRSISKNFDQFILEFPRLKTHFKDLITAHYSFNIFELPEAKAEYLDPDLLPFI